MRARDLGIPFDGQCGPWNAITDVPGVEVGFCTVIRGESCMAEVTVTEYASRESFASLFIFSRT